MSARVKLRPTVDEYDRWHGVPAVIFNLHHRTPVFHAWNIVGVVGNVFLQNESTNCGRDTRAYPCEPATTIPVRHARLFARPCRRCFNVEATA